LGAQIFMKKFFTPFFGLIALIILALLGNILILSDTFPLKPSEKEQGSDAFKITLLTTPDCDYCFPLNPFTEYFTENGIEDDQVKEVAFDSFAGKKLVKKYGITQVPTVIVDGPVSENAFMSEMTESIAELREGAYIVNKLQPPFLDLEEDRIVGEFTVTYLDDETCKECYDVTMHEDVLDRLVMVPQSTRTVDIASDEGIQLIKKYEITAIPTVLFQGEVDIYEQIVDIWGTVGSVEEDGSYVLRRGVESMGPYQLIPEGELVYPVIEDPEQVVAE
jgi:hypothetical protein